MEERLEAGDCRSVLRGTLGSSIWEAIAGYQPLCLVEPPGISMQAAISGHVRPELTSVSIFDAVREYSWKTNKS